VLLRRLRKASPANKDIPAFDLFESLQTNPVRQPWLLRRTKASLLLILICFYYVFSLAYAIFFERKTNNQRRAEPPREEERVCVCSRTGMNLIIFTRGRAAADFL
jgi:hypothetical protein